MNREIMSAVFFIAALACVAAVALICIFLFGNGLPAIFKIGPAEFLTGTEWSPSDIPPLYGILSMIVGSICVTLGAVLIGVPVGILTAVYLDRVCSPALYRFLKPGINLLAGIPSVVYGFFGLAVIVPIFGYSIVSASVLLGTMILPTVISLTETSLHAVPSAYYEGALALGAGHYRSIFTVVLPAAKSGTITAAALGVGRAIGETMAVIMVAGNQARLPVSIFKGVRTLTANIVIEMGYAAGLHREALIATGAVLFVFILLINLGFAALGRRSER